jgi:hypothetical protein
MRNYRDLVVWQKAHRLNPGGLQGDAKLPGGRAFRAYQSTPARGGFDCGQFGGRLWATV